MRSERENERKKCFSLFVGLEQLADCYTVDVSVRVICKSIQQIIVTWPIGCSLTLRSFNCWMPYIHPIWIWGTAYHPVADIESGQVLLEFSLHNIESVELFFTVNCGSMLWLKQQSSSFLLTEFQYMEFGMRNTSLSTAQQRSSADGQKSDKSKL